MATITMPSDNEFCNVILYCVKKELPVVYPDTFAHLVHWVPLSTNILRQRKLSLSPSPKTCVMFRNFYGIHQLLQCVLFPLTGKL